MILFYEISVKSGEYQQNRTTRLQNRRKDVYNTKLQCKNLLIVNLLRACRRVASEYSYNGVYKFDYYIDKLLKPSDTSFDGLIDARIKHETHFL